MILAELPLAGAYELTSEPHEDERGLFARLFCERELAPAGLPGPVVQINLSRTTSAGAVRGMHFQHPPHAEAKIVRCLRGEAYDVLVDLRADSPTLLKWHAVRLAPTAMNAVLIPRGFAHGFQALAPDTELLYLHTEFYTPGAEGGLRHDDPALGIDWPLPPADLSARDKAHPLLDRTFKGIVI